MLSKTLTNTTRRAKAYVDRASFPGFLDETEFKCALELVLNIGYNESML